MGIVASVLAPHRSSGELLASWLTRAPQWVAGLLVIGLGVQLAMLVADLSGGNAPPPAPVVSTPASPVRSSIDVGAVRSANLFGAPTAVAGDPTNAPITSMPLVLVGVLAAEDPAEGYAILGPAANSAKLYAAGATVPGGAKLAGIYSDRVVLDRGGQLETLPMPRQRSPVTAAPAPPPPMPSPAERMSRLTTENPGIVGQLIRAQAVLSNGQQRGYRVFPAPNRDAVFAKLGLRAGDMVTHINGTPLDDPQRGPEIFGTLSSAAEARVTVVRNGRSSDVTLNLADVARQMEQINAAGAQPEGDAGQPPPVPRTD